MEKKTDFIIFCIESYKQRKNISGKEAFKNFRRFNVFKYLENYYDVLHSTGQKYLVNDIEKYINSRKR